MVSPLHYHLDKSLDNELNHSIIAYIFEIIGCKAVYSHEINKDKIHLYYGSNLNTYKSTNVLWIKYNAADLIWSEVIYEENVDVSSKIINFDIISALKSYLSDSQQDNKNENFDNHDRLIYKKSFKATNRIPELPLINIYINHLKKVITKHLSINLELLYPPNKKAAIILSHDVDVPLKYALIKNYRLFPPNRNIKEIIHYHVEYYYMLLKYLFDKNKNENWVFDEIIESELKYEFKSTFFFAVTNNCQKGAYIKDVDYNVLWKEFNGLFTKLIRKGFEVGLHLSYNAYKNQNLIENEKKSLEKIIQKKIFGTRHHFWHLGKDFINTLRFHQESSLNYDSSLAFNDAPGFRNSISLPFHPIDMSNNRSLKIMEIPTFLMDGNLLYNPQTTVEEATRRSISLIDTVRKHDGVGAIDWHVRTSFPKSKKYENWGLVYQNILEYLSSQTDIWVTNFNEVHSWFEVRHNKIQR